MPNNNIDNRENEIPKLFIEEVRRMFPSVSNAEYVLMDNGGGAQIPKMVLDRVNDYLLTKNYQRNGRYASSVAVNKMISDARKSVALLLNSDDENEISFGMNATAFIHLVSSGFGALLSSEDGRRNEIILTDMDHDANISTWLNLAKVGAVFKFWEMRDDGNLHVEDLVRLLSPRTRLVACTAAAHAIGSLVDVASVADLTHDAGAELFVDCVHYLPHGLVDVRRWDCDYLVCSGYKCFSPHMAFLWGKLELLEKLPTLRFEMTPNRSPVKFENGTFIYENVCGMDAVVHYIEALGSASGGENVDRRQNIVAGMTAIRNHELLLAEEMLKAFDTPRVKVYGITESSLLAERVPTFCFNVEGAIPRRIVEDMAAHGIAIRDGHMQAPRLMRKFGLSIETGAIRASLLHYNTVEEVSRFGETLKSVIARAD